MPLKSWVNTAMENLKVKIVILDLKVVFSFDSGVRIDTQSLWPLHISMH